MIIIICFILILVLGITKMVLNNQKINNVENNKINRTSSRRKSIDFVVKVAIFSTIASLLYAVPFLQFKLPFFPAFLEFQFSNLPAILGGFIMGPWGGILILIIKTLVKLPLSSTGYVGEFADLIIGICIVVVSTIIYRKNRTIKGGIIALCSGTLVWVVGAVLMNWLVLIDWYAFFYFGGSKAPIIGMCQAVIPSINETNFMPMYLFACCLPFNLCLSLGTSIITFIVYKKVSAIFKKEFLKK